MMKRVVTIQDVSCIGKCSATVALPIISVMGSECAVIPTAVLSTHTMFQGFTFRDLTSDIPAIVDHWKKENFKFDAIYTGYLGSFEQLQLVSDFIDTFKTDSNESSAENITTVPFSAFSKSGSLSVRIDDVPLLIDETILHMVEVLPVPPSPARMVICPFGM